ncbi:class I SAM-dependent methyltransferase [Phycicoccus sonneratiae]|uniref:Methyltransferase domain-containing protein n=1 Tax=Phycicoccus sonneratiae TaxID=2807628 RepID=A0ABS2CH66_9MICO|nr:class I SAM-dependent methyltransferase [Phycicoccus sonneraticus]MBM6399209.1 methyltransferase domain-containing protein [Phycicoccus sonneraticus]
MDATTWDARYAGAELVWSSTPNRFVEEICAPLPPGRVLDVAAGEGRNALWLAERGWDATAADFSPVAVERARGIAAERLGPDAGPFRAVVADALGAAPAPTGGDGYDLVLFAYLQLPDDQWRRALTAGVAAAAPGGTVLVVCHAARNLTEGAGGPQDAAVLHDPDDVVAAVAGLPVEVESSRLREREVEGAARPALDTVVVLRRLAE